MPATPTEKVPSNKAPAKPRRRAVKTQAAAPAGKPAARAPRKRVVKKVDGSPEGVVDTRSVDSAARTASRESAQQVEQLAVLSAALLFGLIGFAVHVLWFASIVMMAALLGLMASGLRRRGDRGVVSEVVSQVKLMAAEISGSEPIAEGADSKASSVEETEAAED
jgi:hypothetical protein